MITIQEGIAVPEVTRSGKGPPPLYPLRTMTSGQSFFVPGPKATHRVCSAIRNKGLSDLFTVRSVIETDGFGREIAGARCFRI